MQVVELFNRSKNDYVTTMSPRLLLVANKPLSNDTTEIFNSPLGTEYLTKCFESKYKSINTHVTYIEEENTPFVYSILFNILAYYLSRKQLNVKDITLGFIGQSAFNSFIKDIKATETSDNITCKKLVSMRKVYIDEDKKIINLLYSPMYSEFITIPYTILPEVEEDLSSLIEKLNNLKSIGETNSKYKVPSPYCTTEEMLSKIAALQKANDEKCIRAFRLEGKVNSQTHKIEYFSISDNFFNTSLTYCPTDEQCRDDDINVKKLLVNKVKELLVSLKVYGETAAEVIDAFKVKDVNFINAEEYKIANNAIVLPPSFDIIDMTTNKSVLHDSKLFLEAKGTRSQWYDKWINEVYYKVDPNELKVSKYELPNEPRYEWIYDIEVFKYDFLLVAYSMDKRFKVVCWNDFDTLERWITNKILIGFNNAAYDDSVVKYAIARHKILKDPKVDPIEKNSLISVKKYSDILIEGQKYTHPLIMKYSPFFISWDISFHGPFDIRRNSLKKLTMSVLNRRNYDSSVPFNLGRALTEAERADVEKYCAMDVDNTISLYLPDPADTAKQKENPKHKFREFAKDSYDIKWNLINTYKMRARTLINKSSSFAGKLLCGEDTKPNPNNTYKMVNGKKQFYLIPEMAYKELAGTPLLDFYIKNQDNPDYLAQKFEYWMDDDPKDEGHKYQFGFGGLHQALVKYGSKNLLNMDVASLYPSLLIQYHLMSRGASRNPDSYEQVYDTRIEAKHNGNTLLNQGLKLILNGAIGAMLSEYNPLYDTWSNSSICVHGQLLVFILAKRLHDAGLNIVQTNTDGIMIETKEGIDHMAIAEQWMKETRLVLEFDEIAILQQNNVNNYYCQFTNGKVKSKGFYLSNEKYGKATSKILCNLVTDKPLYEGVEPRDYVIYKKHSIGEIYDAKTRTKVDGRSLAFVVGYENDPETGAYYSRSKNERCTVMKDEKGHKIAELDAEGKPKVNEKGEIIYKEERVNTESKINGFTEHMLLVDDINELKLEQINTKEYVAFAKNLLDKEEEFGPYYNENFVKTEDTNIFQALNQLKDNTDSNPNKSNCYAQNFLFECDYLTREEQEEIIERIKDSLYRVVWSGNRSYHMIIRLNHPVSAINYKILWYYFQKELKLPQVDEAGAGLPSKYTRVPDQINPKTGNLQTLYSYDKNIIDVDKILDDLPRLKSDCKPIKAYKGKRTIEALKKHIAKLDFTEGNRFTACQKLSPSLIGLVTLNELLELLPCTLDKDQLYVLKGKYNFFEKHRDLYEKGTLDE